MKGNALYAAKILRKRILYIGQHVFHMGKYAVLYLQELKQVVGNRKEKRKDSNR